MFLTGADPGFLLVGGGGGRKRLFALTHNIYHEREAQSHLRAGILMISRAI